MLKVEVMAGSSVPVTSESDASMRQRLFTSLSQSFPGSALSKALQFMPDSDDEDLKPDRLSSSCFAELRMERNNDGNNNDDESDDDLTSLEWLQETNLLKNLNTNDAEGDQKENGNPLEEPAPQQPRPSHIPYNPYKHVNNKPPYSFSCLIFMAVEDSPDKRLPVKDIYNWILTHFPYFQNAPTGWKNSVRHNLSLNKCFKKVDKDRGQAIGKGSLWCIDPDYRPHLLQALRKTPYHPYHQLQMLATPQISLQGFLPSKPYPLSNHYNNFSHISPHLFPFLSKRLGESKSELDKADIEIANTLVALKSRSQSANGSPNSDFARRLRRKLLTRRRRHDLQDVICTSFPSQDHTYSTMTSPGRHDDDSDSPSSSIDDEYDFGSDDDRDDLDDVTDYSSCHSDYDEVDGGGADAPACQSARKRKTPAMRRHERWSRKRRRNEEDENMKIAEGANALLNLAGITNTHIVSLRSISPDSGNNTTPCTSSTDLYGEGKAREWSYTNPATTSEGVAAGGVTCEGRTRDAACVAVGDTEVGDKSVGDMVSNVTNTDLRAIISDVGDMDDESSGDVTAADLAPDVSRMDMNSNIDSKVETEVFVVQAVDMSLKKGDV